MSGVLHLVLETLCGPEHIKMELDGGDVKRIGRSLDSDLVLRSGGTVSRHHATLTKHSSPTGAMWKLQDTGSRHGTFLNGIKLKEGLSVRVQAGDMITIEPYTFQIVDRDQAAQFTQTFDDAQSIRTDCLDYLSSGRAEWDYAKEQLAALLECSSAIHSADTEQRMASAVIEAVRAGTAFHNVALIRPIGCEGKVEVLAAKGRIAQGGAPQISRSLLQAAMKGDSVCYKQSEETENHAQSIMQYGIEVALCIPIKIGYSVAGCLYIDNRDGQISRQAIEEDYEFCSALAEITALAMSNLMQVEIERRHVEERNGLLLGTVSALVSAIDAKDTYTRGHSERVAWLAKSIGKALKLDHDTVEQLHISGLVHDIGKIGIPETILCKPSRLTEDEYTRIREHPAIGENILLDVPQLKSTLPGVRSHHERWDGGGYPDGTKEKATPLFGRILGVADAFDAMCSSRAYRKALDREKVINEITTCAGSQFDPVLAEAFLQIDFSHYDEMISRHDAQTSGDS